MKIHALSTVLGLAVVVAGVSLASPAKATNTARNYPVTMCTAVSGDWTYLNALSYCNRSTSATTEVLCPLLSGTGTIESPNGEDVFFYSNGDNAADIDTTDGYFYVSVWARACRVSTGGTVTCGEYSAYNGGIGSSSFALYDVNSPTSDFDNGSFDYVDVILGEASGTAGGDFNCLYGYATESNGQP